MYYYRPGPMPYGVGPNFYNPYQQNIPGYNSGYYTGQYGYQNPYYDMVRQRQQYEEELKEKVNQDNIAELIAKKAYQYNGKDVGYKRSTTQFSDNQATDIRRYTYENQKLDSIANTHRAMKGKKFIPREKLAIKQNIAAQQEEDSKHMNYDADLFEFMEEGYKLNVAIEERTRLKSERDLRQLYDQNSYQRLLSMHNIAGYNVGYDNIQPITIDDMEVSLPSNITNNAEYTRRRAEFIADITSRQRT